MTEVIAPGTFNKGIARVNDVGHSYFYESPSLLSLFGGSYWNTPEKRDRFRLPIREPRDKQSRYICCCDCVGDKLARSTARTNVSRKSERPRLRFMFGRYQQNKLCCVPDDFLRLRTEDDLRNSRTSMGRHADDVHTELSRAVTDAGACVRFL
jgi:hypothetical protein